MPRNWKKDYGLQGADSGDSAEQIVTLRSFTVNAPVSCRSGSVDWQQKVAGKEIPGGVAEEYLEDSGGGRRNT